MRAVRRAKGQARLSLWVDYAYMLIYGAFLTAVAISVRRGAAARGNRRLAAAGSVAVPAALAAPACDAVENAWLLIALGGEGGDLAPMLGALFAAAKFVALVVAIAYGLWGGVAALRARSAAPA